MTVQRRCLWGNPQASMVRPVEVRLSGVRPAGVGIDGDVRAGAGSGCGSGTPASTRPGLLVGEPPEVGMAFAGISIGLESCRHRGLRTQTEEDPPRHAPYCSLRSGWDLKSPLMTDDSGSL